MDLTSAVTVVPPFRPQALQELFTVGMVLASRAGAQEICTSPVVPDIHCCDTRSIDTSRKSCLVLLRKTHFQFAGLTHKRSV
jgi:hypothetical protein